MNNSSRYIRLVGAVTAAAISCAFVSIYSWASQVVMRYEPNHRGLPEVAEVLVHYANYAFVVPALFLFTGLRVVRRNGNDAKFELSVIASWVFAFSWLAYALLAWRIAQIPEFGLRPD